MVKCGIDIGFDRELNLRFTKVRVRSDSIKPKELQRL